ncbi:unnamed protein product, partial [Heterotrigona itama]
MSEPAGGSPKKVSEWSRSGHLFWADPENWRGSSIAAPHLEQVPCRQDDIVLPSGNRTFSVLLPVRSIEVRSVRTTSNRGQSYSAWQWADMDRKREFEKGIFTVKCVSLVLVRGLQLRQMSLPRRSERLLSGRDLRHREAKVWIHSLRISFMGILIIVQLIKIVRSSFLLVIENVPGYTEVTLKRHVGGGPLLSILWRSSIFDEESVFVDGSSGDRRGFGRIRDKTRLARQTYLERAGRASDKKKGRLFGTRYPRSHGRREESPSKYVYSLNLEISGFILQRMKSSVTFAILYSNEIATSSSLGQHHSIYDFVTSYCSCR